MPYVNPHWLRPSQSSCEDIPSSVGIPVKMQTTMRTIMPANREVFAYLSVAAAAFLACSPGVNFHEHDASLFSFASERCQKNGPTSIGNRTSQPVVLEHPDDVQAFHSDEPVSTDQTISDLMMMFPSQVPYPSMHLLEASNCLLAILPACFLPADRSAEPAKFGEYDLQVSGVRLVVAFGIGKEGLQAYIDANRGRVLGLIGRVPRSQDRTRYHLPASILSVAVFTVPSKGRCNLTRMTPTC